VEALPEAAQIIQTVIEVAGKAAKDKDNGTE
jgi:hypothetical protein